jgi:cell division protein FtsA
MASRTKSARAPFGVLDLGSSKMACLIAEPTPDGLVLLGQAMHASDGIRMGEIVDMDQFSASVGKTVQAAERNAGLTIKDIHLVTPGGQPAIQICRSRIDLSDPIISRRDIRRLGAKQSEMSAPEGRRISQSHRLQYLVDGQRHIQNPNGMRATELAADTAVLSHNSLSFDNMSEAVAQNHLQVGHVHHSGSVAGLSCLTEEERDLGAIILDMGGGTTAISAYLDNKIIFASTVQMGGQHITRDIARVLSLAIGASERLKAIEGSVMLSGAEQQRKFAGGFPSQGDNFVLSHTVSASDSLSLPNGETIERQLLSDIIRTRLDDILEAVDDRLERSRMKQLCGNTIVLTGGASQLTGLSDYVTSCWSRSVRIATPHGLTGLDGQITGGPFAASLGMALFVHNNHDDETALRVSPSASRTGLFGKFGHWFKEHI